MSFRTGLGIAFSQHGQLAGNLAAIRALEFNPEPDVAILFASSHLEPKDVLAGVRSALGNVPVFGSTAQAMITNVGKTERTVSVLLLSSDRLKATVRSAPVGVEADEACRRLLAGVARDEARANTSLMVCSDHFMDIGAWLRALDQAHGQPIPVTGGGSIGPPDEENWNVSGAVQFAGNQALSGSVAMLHLESLDPERLRFAYAYESCWTPIAHPVRCTKAKGNQVWEVDHIPIHDYLRTYLGNDFRDELKSTSWKYTFVQRLMDEDPPRLVVRTPNWRHANSGPDVVTFFPREDMEDAEIELVQVSREELLIGTTQAAERALAALDGATPQAVFAFSCQLRRRFLHSRGDEEVARIREVFGDSVPVIGFYAGGELGPLYSRHDDVVDAQRAYCGSHPLSTSISILAVGDTETPQREGSFSEHMIRWLKEDRGREYEGEDAAKRILELVRLLEEAERMIDETEHAFKHINKEHYQLARAMQDRNYALARAQRQGERLQKIIRQYTPHNVWRKAQHSVDQGYYTIPNEELDVALMFLDVKGFTAFADKHGSTEVVREINRIFEPATAIIYDHGGDVDKFIGDCIFATFDQVERAVDAALEIQAMMRVLTHEGSPFSIRVGINSGRVVSGNVGGTARRDNTLIGDAVNVAQRLESACKPGAVLVSRAVFHQVREALPLDLRIDRREVAAKGKAEPVEAFELTPAQD